LRLHRFVGWPVGHGRDDGRATQVRVGRIADLTLFIPKTVAPRATYKNGGSGLPPVDIADVIVNGTIVVKDSEVLKDVHPGQPIRFPVQDKPRLEPLSVDGRANRNLVAPTGFFGLEHDAHFHCRGDLLTPQRKTRWDRQSKPSMDAPSQPLRSHRPRWIG